LTLVPLVDVLGVPYWATAAFRFEVNALSTAAVSGSVDDVLLLVELGFISCNNAFIAVLLRLAESVASLPIPRSAETSWPAIVEVAILFSWLVDALVKALELRFEGRSPSL
jgi:hypothetical protein